MSCELVNPDLDDTPANYLSDGDVAVITKWDEKKFLGQVVQMVLTTTGHYELIVINSTDKFYYDDFLDGDTYRVKMLKTGTEIRLVE